MRDKLWGMGEMMVGKGEEIWDKLWGMGEDEEKD